MKYLLSTRTVAVALLLTCALPALPHAAAAQTNPTLTNVIPEAAAVTLHAKITAIDTGTRAVTLAGASGTAVTVTAGPLVRLDLLKVGDRVNVKYYRSIGFVVNPPAGGDASTVARPGCPGCWRAPPARRFAAAAVLPSITGRRA